MGCISIGAWKIWESYAAQATKNKPEETLLLGEKTEKIEGEKSE